MAFNMLSVAVLLYLPQHKMTVFVNVIDFTFDVVIACSAVYRDRPVSGCAVEFTVYTYTVPQAMTTSNTLSYTVISC